MLEVVGKLAPVLLTPFLWYNLSKEKDKWNGNIWIFQKLQKGEVNIDVSINLHTDYVCSTAHNIDNIPVFIH